VLYLPFHHNGLLEGAPNDHQRTIVISSGYPANIPCHPLIPLTHLAAPPPSPLPRNLRRRLRPHAPNQHQRNLPLVQIRPEAIPRRAATSCILTFIIIIIIDTSVSRPHRKHSQRPSHDPVLRHPQLLYQQRRRFNAYQTNRPRLREGQHPL
jgi:hypothetical protein